LIRTFGSGFEFEGLRLGLRKEDECRERVAAFSKQDVRFHPEHLFSSHDGHVLRPQVAALKLESQSRFYPDFLSALRSVNTAALWDKGHLCHGGGQVAGDR